MDTATTPAASGEITRQRLLIEVERHVHVCIARPLHSRPKRIPKLEKYPIFADSGREKHPFFNWKRWFWGPIKHPFLKQNAILFSLYKIKYPFCESEIKCIKHFFFLRTSYFSLCLIWDEYLYTHPSRSDAWKPGWRQVDTCDMFTLFQHFADLTLFLDSANLWKITPFFAKVGTSVVFVLTRSWGAGMHRRFRWWLVSYSNPGHCLNQCWFIVNWSSRNRFRWNWI